MKNYENYEFWGKPMSEWSTGALVHEVDRLAALMYTTKIKYRNRADDGDDTLWYQFEAMSDERERYMQELHDRGCALYDDELFDDDYYDDEDC